MRTEDKLKQRMRTIVFFYELLEGEFQTKVSNGLWEVRRGNCGEAGDCYLQNTFGSFQGST